ncbi:MAG: 3-phosphoserine/phosphohydroxythreonine transaminase, partial [Deltaproteobacteria bacterium]|nr:3-phosphoserine/phosphohydroxythreonine transaminase [Deltaproteobacteria bacterium]
MTKRVFNFNAGPAALPLPVLEEIQAELLDYKGTGMSVMEMSHRSKAFEGIINDAVERTKRLLNIGEDYHVLFIQGGASLQFAMVPMNLAVPGKPIDYIDTGSWPSKAIKEAKIQGKDVRIIASSKDRNYSYITTEYKVDKDASYLHYTTNNTIEGTQWSVYPESQGVPIVCDMSSDFMCRPIDIKKFGLVYAGAQKNIGPAGSAMVVIRKDMLERTPDNIPTMMKYTTHAKENSLYNTPSCFVIYTIGLVMKWLE